MNRKPNKKSEITSAAFGLIGAFSFVTAIGMQWGWKVQLKWI
jgi:hypothetical protein